MADPPVGGPSGESGYDLLVEGWLVPHLTKTVTEASDEETTAYGVMTEELIHIPRIDESCNPNITWQIVFRC